MKHIELLKDTTYKDWLVAVKSKINSAQQKAAISVNKELIRLYFYLSEQLYHKKKTAQWGDKVLQQVAQDIKKEFPKIKGFSHTNLKYMRSFYTFYSANELSQQPVDLLSEKLKIILG